MNAYEPNNLDADLQSLDDALSSLGKADRSAPDAGFEPRVLDSIDAALAPEPIRIETRRPAWAAAVRMAAGVAIVAGVGVVSWLGIRPAPTPGADPSFTLASVESDVDLLAELFETNFSDSYNAIAGEIELVGSEAADDPFWTTFEALSISLDQGAI